MELELFLKHKDKSVKGMTPLFHNSVHCYFINQISTNVDLWQYQIKKGTAEENFGLS